MDQESIDFKIYSEEKSQKKEIKLGNENKYFLYI